jgi:hypothetical protein
MDGHAFSQSSSARSMVTSRHWLTKENRRRGAIPVAALFQSDVVGEPASACDLAIERTDLA